MKKQYIKPEVLAIPLIAPMLLSGSPNGYNDVVSDREALSREFEWDDEE